MTTALQIIDKARTLIGVRGIGETTPADEVAECLVSLNSLIDSWRTSSLFAYATQRVTATLAPGVNVATIGPTGAFVVTPRPVRIEAGSFYTVGGIDYPITSINAEQFNSIGLKATGDLGPACVYFDTAYPQGTLYFFPQAESSVSVTLMCMVQVAAFANIATEYELAPGYQRALSYTLAEEIAADYQAKVPPTVAKSALQSRRAIKRANHSVGQLAQVSRGYSPVGGFIAGWE